MSISVMSSAPFECRLWSPARPHSASRWPTSPSASLARSGSRCPVPTSPSICRPTTLLPEVERFVATLGVQEPETVLATVLFTDIVGSTEKLAELGNANWRELVERHHALVRRQLGRFRGREIDTAGHGFFATFDGPIRAVRCAAAIQGSVRELGIEIRAGLHVGECELVGEKIAGIAVNVGARIAAQAEPGEILVSSTVKDLVAGSDLEFEDRGTVELKGIPGGWQLYKAHTNPVDRAAL